jgi:hypothetical protein
MIEARVYETTVKPMPLRKRLHITRFVLVAILALCFNIPLTSAAAPGTNSFTGSASVPDLMTFATTGSMNVPRRGHSATLLNNGKVLVVGGSGLGNTAEVYDPTTGTWSTTGNLLSERGYDTITLLNNGKVLVAGRWNGTFSELTRTELYDPDTGTWTATGSMNGIRTQNSATLLNNGKVLIAGGANGSIDLSSAELYDPVAGTWSTTGSMNVVRILHRATILNDGKVLVAGGWVYSDIVASAELYDPVAGTWSYTGSMTVPRSDPPTILLNNGKVLVVGGANPGTSTELYDPSTGTWSITGSPIYRINYSTTLLNNGKVLVAGGWGTNSLLASTELYDPVAGTWGASGSLNFGRYQHTATLLNNGQVLVAGGYDGTSTLASAELGTLIPGNTFTGTLTLPSGWLNSTTISAQFVGTTSGAAINAGALSNDNTNWGSWVAATPSVTTTTTWDVGGEGANIPIYLRLRDVNDQAATVVTGTVNVDLTKPTSSMTALPAISPANIPLAWTGSDALSGISTYDVQVRAGLGGAWTDVLSNTTNTSTNYTGANGITYYFRTRANDAAGNVEDWPSDYDTFTVVDDEATNGTVVINGGVANTNVMSVTLTLSASDPGSGVAQMSFSNDGNDWSTWQAYTTSASWTLVTGDGSKTVYAHFEDGVGNVSTNATDTITLDTVAPTGSVVIDGGATYAASTSVSLTLEATDATSGLAQMSFSNDGSSWSAWEDFATSKVWTLSSGDGSKTVYARYKDNAGNISSSAIDTIILDTTPPNVSVSALGAYQASLTFSVSWSGTDATSGIANYDVQFRDGTSGTWTDWITATTALSATFTGQDNHAYAFRARAWDNVDNVSAYSSGDAQTTVDVTAPTPGDLIINGGALTTTALNVTLSLLATDITSGVAMMSFSNDGSTWSEWQSYATHASWSLLSGDGVKTVYARFRDAAGNVSSSVSNTIELDTATEAEYGLTINDGAVYTNQTAVGLTIGAQAGTAQMQVSNDGGFAGATWEPYVSHKAWAIIQNGSYGGPRVVYIRFKDSAGIMSGTFQDDIILDVTPPVGSVSIIGTTGLQAMASTVTLGLSATDDVSGVGQMLISNQPDFAGSTWEPYSTSRAWELGANGIVYVRYRDNAGNVSTTYTTTGITYTISGDTGVAGVALSYTDGYTQTATSAADGSYSFSVSYNWSGTVTPSKAGYTFSPVNRPYTNVVANQTGQDYTATAITYIISGNAGVDGATLSYTDGTPKISTSAADGSYSFSVSYNWSGTVIPSKAGYFFTPANRIYTDVLSDLTGQNYTAAIAFRIYLPLVNR